MRWFSENCFEGLTNNNTYRREPPSLPYVRLSHYRSVSITTSKGFPYKISIVGVGPIDIHRRVVHKIGYRSRSTIYIEGLSTVKNKYLSLKMVFSYMA